MSQRLDIELVNRKLAESRERAKAYIMEGIVFVNDQKAQKPGDKVDEHTKIEVRGNKLPYVSRGGLKLEKAIDVFDISLIEKVCVDIGASTGGFTDCMLINGASKVYSIDVGYGQLAWKLRCDDRVVNIERTNIRHFDESLITDEVSFVSVDVSFISLKLVLPKVYSILKDNGEAVVLIKPQFEAGREEVGKKGVVRDAKIHEKVIEKCVSFAQETGFSVLKLDFSPIKGPEGNIEFLLYLSKDGENENYIDGDTITTVVTNSHS